MNHWVVAFMLVVVVSLGQVSAGVVETLDSQRMEGTIVSIEKGTVTLKTAKGVQKLAVGQVLRMELSSQAGEKPQAGLSCVSDVHGGQVLAEQVELSGDKVIATHSKLGQVEIPLAQVHEVLFPRKGQTIMQLQEELRAQRQPKANSRQDLLIVQQKADKWVVLEGVVKSFDASVVVFHWNGEDRRVKRKLVRGLKLARAAGGKSKAAGLVRLTDGARIPFAEITLSVEKAELQPVYGDRMRVVQVAHDAIAEISFVSDRMVQLSQLTPKTVEQYGLLGEGFAYRVGHNAAGGELRLGGTKYSDGLGLHSFCQLEYELGGEYTRLIALAGIDDAARPRGDARLRFLADGNDLTAPVDLKGTDKPVSIRVDVQNVKTLVIRVEFGQDQLDSGDHVNLVNARLIR